jgi:hypothetical protein
VPSPLGQTKAWKASLPESKIKKQNKPIDFCSVRSTTSFLGNSACWRCNRFLLLIYTFSPVSKSTRIVPIAKNRSKTEETATEEKEMSIFKELRRRSKASFRTTTSTDSQSNGNAVSGQSSSTIGTIESSTTPPSSIKPSLSSPNLSTLNEAVNGSAVPPVPSPLPQRPVPITSQSNRHSYYVYAPSQLLISEVLLYYILTVTPNNVVHQWLAGEWLYSNTRCSLSICPTHHFCVGQFMGMARSGTFCLLSHSLSGCLSRYIRKYCWCPAT